MAVVIDKGQNSPTACPTAAGATSEVPSLLIASPARVDVEVCPLMKNQPPPRIRARQPPESIRPPPPPPGRWVCTLSIPPAAHAHAPSPAAPHVGLTAAGGSPAPAPAHCRPIPSRTVRLAHEFGSILQYTTAQGRRTAEPSTAGDPSGRASELPPNAYDHRGSRQSLQR